jgi:hypothetical protein
MRNVRLTRQVLVGRTHLDAGTEIDLHDDRAAQLIKAGHAEATGNLPAPPPRKPETAQAKPAPRKAARYSGRTGSDE